MSFALFVRLAWTELRGARGRALFFAACLSVGVAAVVGISALSSSIVLGLRVRSRALLGGDIAVEARRPLPDVMALLPEPYRSHPPAHAELCILPTMARSANGRSRLVEIKAVDLARGLYPLVGTLAIDPPQASHERLDAASVWVAPEVLTELNVVPGASIHIGEAVFRVAGVVREEAEQLGLSLALGPRVLMTTQGLARTRVLGFGDRVRYRTLLGLPAGTPEAELARIKDALLKRLKDRAPFISVETHAEAQPALRATFDRLSRYLGLVALLSLLLGSVGAAQIVAAWLTRAIPQTAVLRCLGLTPREVVAVYLGEIGLLALLGSSVGAGLGALAPALVARAYPDLIPSDVARTLPLGSMLQGVCLGISLAVLFSLPALTAVWRVSPALVLQSSTAPLPTPRALRVVAVLLGLLGAFSAAWLQSQSPRFAAAFTLGCFGLACVLILAARVLIAMLRRLPRARLPVLVWHGAAALTRVGAGTVGGIVALGMGSLVVLSIALVQDLFGHELATALPRAAPSVFLVDVQPDQWPALQRLARSLGADRAEAVPVLTARLSAIDGRPVAQLAKERAKTKGATDRSHWVLTREQRMTWARSLPDDNRVLEGALWSDPHAAELSVEEGFAKDLGVSLGSKLSLDVQGVSLDFKVTSLRSVRWRSFSMNFFLLAEPGFLEDAPHFMLGSVRAPEASEQGLQDALAQAFPNVTMLRVRNMLARVSELVERAALAVRLLGGFALVTGFVMLIGTIASSQLRRAREVALLKTLGLTRLQIATMFGIEYALAGAVAGCVGSCGAYALSLLVARELLEIAAWPSLSLSLSAFVAIVLLSVGGGLIASAGALRRSPLAVLRDGP